MNAKPTNERGPTHSFIDVQSLLQALSAICFRRSTVPAIWYRGVNGILWDIKHLGGASGSHQNGMKYLNTGYSCGNWLGICSVKEWETMGCNGKT